MADGRADYQGNCRIGEVAFVECGSSTDKDFVMLGLAKLGERIMAGRLADCLGTRLSEIEEE